MNKENKATVYALDKGAYLINKQPQLINDRHLKYELQRSEMYFKNTKEYIRCTYLNFFCSVFIYIVTYYCLLTK